MILADTSAWIDHLRSTNPKLKGWLLNGEVLMHPCVIGELACGSLKNRSAFLNSLHELPAALVADDSEVMHLIEAQRLYGRGLGWIDAHLLASARLSGSALFTLDRRLNDAASDWT